MLFSLCLADMISFKKDFYKYKRLAKSKQNLCDGFCWGHKKTPNLTVSDFKEFCILKFFLSYFY